jgi:hypothetical protein
MLNYTEHTNSIVTIPLVVILIPRVANARVQSLVYGQIVVQRNVSRLDNAGKKNHSHGATHSFLPCNIMQHAVCGLKKSTLRVTTP